MLSIFHQILTYIESISYPKNFQPDDMYHATPHPQDPTHSLDGILKEILHMQVDTWLSKASDLRYTVSLLIMITALTFNSNSCSPGQHVQIYWEVSFALSGSFERMASMGATDDNYRIGLFWNASRIPFLPSGGSSANGK
jgi:hypothetical protein